MEDDNLFRMGVTPTKVIPLAQTDTMLQKVLLKATGAALLSQATDFNQ